MCFLVFTFFCLCFTLILPSLFFPSPVFSKGLKTYYYSRSLFGFTQPFPFSSFDLPCSWTVITCGRYFETPHKKTPKRRNDGDQNGKLFLCSLYIFRSLHYCRDIFLSSNYFMGLSGQYFCAKYFEFTTTVWKIIVPNFCRNDELSSTLSWVGCLLLNRFSATKSTHRQTQLIIAAEIRHIRPLLLFSFAIFAFFSWLFWAEIECKAHVAWPK